MSERGLELRMPAPGKMEARRPLPACPRGRDPPLDSGPRSTKQTTEVSKGLNEGHPARASPGPHPRPAVGPKPVWAPGMGSPSPSQGGPEG